MISVNHVGHTVGSRLEDLAHNWSQVSRLIESEMVLLTVYYFVLLSRASPKATNSICESQLVTKSQSLVQQLAIDVTSVSQLPLMIHNLWSAELTLLIMITQRVQKSLCLAICLANCLLERCWTTWFHAELEWSSSFEIRASRSNWANNSVSYEFKWAANWFSDSISGPKSN